MLIGYPTGHISVPIDRVVCKVYVGAYIHIHTLSFEWPLSVGVGPCRVITANRSSMIDRRIHRFQWVIISIKKLS